MSDTGHREYAVVSVGGSLIVPDGISTEFLKALRDFVLLQLSRGLSFAIVTGGGKTCRRYQAAAAELGVISRDDLDWIGVHVNNMHAEFLRILFGTHAAPDVVRSFSSPLVPSHPVILAGAEAPGHSSDFDAVLMAELLHTRRIVNLSNIDAAYDSDPRENPNARKLSRVSWSEYRSYIPSEWAPGLSTPFDPIASEKAEALGLEVAVINGNRFHEFENYLAGKPFEGTVIS